MGIMAPKLRRLYTRCLRVGVYPQAWRTVRLILLHKGGRPTTSPLAYRPICLSDEVGKLFEKVVPARLEQHMAGRVPGWHESQYGFRNGRLTIDAVRRVLALAEDMVSRDSVALAVSGHRQPVQFHAVEQDSGGPGALRGSQLLRSWGGLAYVSLWGLTNPRSRSHEGPSGQASRLRESSMCTAGKVAGSVRCLSTVTLCLRGLG